MWFGSGYGYWKEYRRGQSHSGQEEVESLLYKYTHYHDIGSRTEGHQGWLQ